MKITVNGEELSLFSGARVVDALRSYSNTGFSAVERGELEVTDRFGHRVDLDGELSEGAELHIRESGKRGQKK